MNQIFFLTIKTVSLAVET